MQRKRAGRPSKSEQRGNTREALLLAAHEAMVESHSIDLSVAEIGDKAGLNPALVSYYFGGKEGLLMELALQHQGEIASSLARLLRHNASAPHKLKLHIRAIIHRNREVPYLQQLHQKLLRETDDASANDYGERLLKPLANFYAALVEQGILEGSFKPIDPMFLYFTILGACDFIFTGISLKRAYDIDEMDDSIVEGYINHTIELICDGMVLSPNSGRKPSRRLAVLPAGPGR